MRVFGFTEERELVPVDLSPTIIAEYRIHPWWVDLFQDNPIVLEVGGRTLFFTRLTDIVFVFEQSEHFPWQIGILDAGQWKCFDLETVDVGGFSSWTYLENPHESITEFSDCFSRFLNQNPHRLPMFQKHKFKLYRGDIIYISEDASELEYRIRSFAYSGKSIEPVRLRVELPENYTWVFDAFKANSPRIIGGSLRDFLQQESLNDIDIIVDELRSEEIKQLLEELGCSEIKELTEFNRYGPLSKPVFEFTHNDVSYHLICRGNFLANNWWYANDFSVNHFYADSPTEIVGSRIALWDLAHRQARIVSRINVSVYSELADRWPERAQKLETRGYTILPNFE